MHRLDQFNEILGNLSSVVDELEANVLREGWYNDKMEKALEIIRGIKNSQLYYVDGGKMDQLDFSPIPVKITMEQAGVKNNERRKIMENDLVHYVKVLLNELNENSEIIIFYLREYNISTYEFLIGWKF